MRRAAGRGAQPERGTARLRIEPEREPCAFSRRSKFTRRFPSEACERTKSASCDNFAPVPSGEDRRHIAIIKSLAATHRGRGGYRGLPRPRGLRRVAHAIYEYCIAADSGDERQTDERSTVASAWRRKYKFACARGDNRARGGRSTSTQHCNFTAAPHDAKRRCEGIAQFFAQNDHGRRSDRWRQCGL